MTPAERPLTDMSAQHDEAIADALVTVGLLSPFSDVHHIIPGMRTQLASRGLSIVSTAERDALVNLARLFEKSVEYEIRRADDEEGRRMKTITLNLIAETLALAGAA